MDVSMRGPVAVLWSATGQERIFSYAPGDSTDSTGHAASSKRHKAGRPGGGWALAANGGIGTACALGFQMEGLSERNH
jgi:hypothetical protein